MVTSLFIDEFIESIDNSVLIDVRSEGEYEQGHFPGSINLPLLNNHEREIVGTIYKQEGKIAAVQKGFELVGGKFHTYIEKAKSLAQLNRIYVYCWRGGMRSNIMAWLLSTAGCEVFILKDGYKSFRSTVLDGINQQRNFIILGGKTGSGKTQMLHLFKSFGAQVIDLEFLANHRGSAFGGIGQGKQPSNEQFENELYLLLRNMKAHDPIWLENESRLIGKIKIPDLLFEQMRCANVIELLVPIESRARRIVNEYGGLPKEQLAEATRAIERKLGNLRMKQALEHLDQNEWMDWAILLLHYYDSFYEYGLTQRSSESVRRVDVATSDMMKEAEAIFKEFKAGMKSESSIKFNDGKD